MDSNHRRACSSFGNSSIYSKSEIPFLDDLPGVAGIVQTPIVRIPIPYLLQFNYQSWLVLYIIPILFLYSLRVLQKLPIQDIRKSVVEVIFIVTLH